MRLPSLRPGLAALALLAAPLALGQERSADEQKASAAVNRLGGKVERDPALPGQPVTVVHIGATGARDADLVPLRVFAELRTLILTYDPVTDAGLAAVGAFRELRDLHLGHTRVTDAGLVHLRGLARLENLWLQGTGVTDQGVAALRQALPRLRIFR
jgi:hypothetical protein